MILNWNQYKVSTEKRNDLLVSLEKAKRGEPAMNEVLTQAGINSIQSLLDDLNEDIDEFYQREGIGRNANGN